MQKMFPNILGLGRKFVCTSAVLMSPLIIGCKFNSQKSFKKKAIILVKFDNQK